MWRGRHSVIRVVKSNYKIVATLYEYFLETYFFSET
jgi:hypothetical protein